MYIIATFLDEFCKIKNQGLHHQGANIKTKLKELKYWNLGKCSELETFVLKTENRIDRVDIDIHNSRVSSSVPLSAPSILLINI